MSEKQIWIRLSRLVLVLVLASLFVFVPSTISLMNSQYAYSSNATSWFVTNGYPNTWQLGYTSCYAPIMGDFDVVQATPEEVMWRANGNYTISNMCVYVGTNGLASSANITLRVNSANQTLGVSVGAGLTGYFQDNTNSDSVTDGDLVCWEISRPAGDFKISFISCIVNGDYPFIAGVDAYTTKIVISAGETTYLNPTGFMYENSDANDTRFYTHTEMTLSKMRFWIDTNTLSGNTTITLYNNGSPGNQAVTIEPSGTGEYMDSVNTDTISAGDYWYYKVVADAGSGTLTMRASQVLTNSSIQLTGPAHGNPPDMNDDNVFYVGINGSIIPTSTENYVKQLMPQDYIVTNLWAYVVTNVTGNTTTITSRINGADGNLSITIPANQTGLFTDLVNSDSVSAGDYYDIEIDIALGAAHITIVSIGMELEPQGEGIVIPTVTTQNATSIEENTATGNGNITATGGENCTERGHEFDIDSGSPYSSNVTNTGSFGTGNFTTSLTGLTPGELYYSRAFAGNSAGYGYGSEITFLTKPNGATSFTDTATTNTSVSLSWTNGTGMDYVEIRYQEDSYVSDNASGTLGYWGSGSSTTINSLSENTTYYFSLYTHATESGLWNIADTVGQDTAYTSNPPPVAASTASWGDNLAGIAICLLVIFVIGAYLIKPMGEKAK